MRSAVVISTVALLGFRSYYCDGLCVGTDHACVLLDDASVKVRAAPGAKRWFPAPRSCLLLLCVYRCWCCCSYVYGLPRFRKRPQVPSEICRCSDIIFGLLVVVFCLSPQCFGLNDYGQLGQGDTDARGQNATSMGDSLGPVDLGTRATVLAMSAGADHTCVVLSGGSVKVRSKERGSGFRQRFV